MADRTFALNISWYIRCKQTITPNKPSVPGGNRTELLRPPKWSPCDHLGHTEPTLNQGTIGQRLWDLDCKLLLLSTTFIKLA